MAKKEDKKNNKEEPKELDRRKLLEARMKALGISPNSLVVGEEFRPPEFIPIGITEIDNLLGEGGGLPKGVVVEFCGDSQSGKTYTAYKLIASAQALGGRCAFFNAEHGFFEARATSLGVQVRNKNLFEMYQGIPSAELCGELLIECAESGDYAVIVLDSITALIPEVELAKGLDDVPKIGAHAMFVQRLIKKLLGPCYKNNTIVVIINQFRQAQGIIPNKMIKKPTGGASLEYWCRMSLWFDQIKSVEGKIIGDNDKVIGGKSRVRTIKTICSQPNLECVFPIYFSDEEVNPLGEFLYVANARGKEFIKVIRKKYQYYNKETGEVLLTNGDAIEFTKGLFDIPPPDYMTKKDNSTNAFEYIAGQLKLTEERINVIKECIENPKGDIVAPADMPTMNYDVSVEASEE
jgi:recombination protein RecA